MELPDRTLSAVGRSLYETLEVPRTSTTEEIKRKYRRLALKYHPDKNPENPEAAEKFKDINAAHSILTDETKRSIYDEYGSLGLLVAQQWGEDNVTTPSVLTNPWCQALFLFCGLITGCYLCCCCCFGFNCCCGESGPKKTAREHSNVNEEPGSAEGQPRVVTTQPAPITMLNAPSSVVIAPPRPSPAAGSVATSLNTNEPRVEMTEEDFCSATGDMQ